MKETGCNQRPKALTDKHPRQSDKTEEWRRRRRQVDQAKDNTDGNTSTKGEHHCTQRNGLIAHSGSLSTDRSARRPFRTKTKHRTSPGFTNDVGRSFSVSFKERERGERARRRQRVRTPPLRGSAARLRRSAARRLLQTRTPGASRQAVARTRSRRACDCRRR